MAHLNRFFIPVNMECEHLYDVVDPEFADFDLLLVPNSERNLGHTC